MAIDRLNKTESDGSVADVSDINPAFSKIDELVDQVNPNTSEITTARDGEATLHARISRDISYLEEFRYVYYGSYSDDPSINPIGNAVNEGDFYWNSTNKKLRVYNGSIWEDVPNYEEVLEYSSLNSFPTTGKTDVIYIASDTNSLYKWNGSSYKIVGGITTSPTLSSTSATVNENDSTTVTITNYNSHLTYTITSSDESIATVSRTGDTITINGEDITDGSDKQTTVSVTAKTPGMPTSDPVDITVDVVYVPITADDALLVSDFTGEALTNDGYDLV